MALVTTTLSAAITASAESLTVASAPSIAVGRLLKLGDDWAQVRLGYVTGSTTAPVSRWLNGALPQAHVSGENVTHGDASDFGDSPAGGIVSIPPMRVVRCFQYAVAGAIALPLMGEDLGVNIAGSAALAMTLASPGKELDFARLTITSSGGADGTVAAHTVTVTAGFGGAGSGYTALTFDANGANGIELQAQNGKWVILNQVDGTLTKVAVSIA